MLVETRRKHILEVLRGKENGAVTITELSEMLGVSKMTVHRDLDFLETKDLLRRVHGGAIAYSLEEAGEPFMDRVSSADLQKKAIAQIAAQLVNDGDILILDAGTTTREVARNLMPKNRITIITNNIPIAVELGPYPQINSILLGGVIKHIELCTVGGMVKQALSLLSADKLFLSAAGISLKRGLTDTDMAEVEVKQAMIHAASEVILVSDSSKVNINAMVQIAPLQEIHKWVTDDSVHPEMISAVEALGIQVITPSRKLAGIA
jgi:DeoR family transcriptional regulator, fructose operon transcriptional repressor